MVTTYNTDLFDSPVSDHILRRILVLASDLNSRRDERFSPVTYRLDNTEHVVFLFTFVPNQKGKTRAACSLKEKGIDQSSINRVRPF